jgi:hypothetical protein
MQNHDDIKTKLMHRFGIVPNAENERPAD